jgi:hypothetical protein
VCDAVWEQLKDARTYTAIDQAFHAAERESVPFG